MRVGFIGLGLMGSGMTNNLQKAGHQLVLHDLRREAAEKLIAGGAEWASSPRDVAASAEVVFTSLPGPAQVEAAALDPETGILAGLRKGGAYIDLTTNSPATVRRVAEAAKKQDIAFLDAPVSGRPPNMTVMVGGREADFGHCKPLFEAIAANVF